MKTSRFNVPSRNFFERFSTEMASMALAAYSRAESRERGAWSQRGGGAARKEKDEVRSDAAYDRGKM
jgi:hypothetical protein